MPCTRRRSCRPRWSSTPASTRCRRSSRAWRRRSRSCSARTVSGRYFNGLQEARADAQAYDADARARLRALSEDAWGRTPDAARLCRAWTCSTRLATDLRERLLAGAGEDGGDLPGRIRALVDREAGVLSEDRRAELVARIAERAFGLGPLEPLLSDPSVDEIMVSRDRAGLGRAARAAGGRPACASSARPTCATRSSASSRPWAAGSTRPSRCATRACPTARA